MKRKCSRCHAIEDESPPPTCEGGIPVRSYQFHDWDVMEFVMSETTQVPVTVSERDEAMFTRWLRSKDGATKPYAAILCSMCPPVPSPCPIPLDGPSAMHSEMSENGDLDTHIQERHTPQSATLTRTTTGELSAARALELANDREGYARDLESQPQAQEQWSIEVASEHREVAGYLRAYASQAAQIEEIKTAADETLRAQDVVISDQRAIIAEQSATIERLQSRVEDAERASIYAKDELRAATSLLATSDAAYETMCATVEEQVQHPPGVRCSMYSWTHSHRCVRAMDDLLADAEARNAEVSLELRNAMDSYAKAIAALRYEKGQLTAALQFVKVEAESWQRSAPVDVKTPSELLNRILPIINDALGSKS